MLGERDGVFRDRFAVFWMRLEVCLFQCGFHEGFAPLGKIAEHLFRFLCFCVIQNFMKPLRER